MSKSTTTDDIIYGVNPAFETILAGRRKIYQACLGRQALRNPRIQTLSVLCKKRGIPVEIHEKGRLIHLACGSRDHQGVVLKTAPYPYASFAETVAAATRLLLLDNIEDPQNVGAILRSAEVLGFRNILLPQKGVPGIYASVAKASAGATEHLRIVREMNATQYAKRLLPENWRILALDASGDMAPRDCSTEADHKILLVIGGENKGVRQFILNSAHAVLRIPQHGRINSLNASAAAAIAMYALREPSHRVEIS